jgi:hypothetical protein
VQGLSGSEADPAVDRLAPLAAGPDQPAQVPERACGESRIRAGAVVLIGCCPSSCGLIDCFVIDACQRVPEACREMGEVTPVDLSVLRSRLLAVVGGMPRWLCV